MHGYASLLVCIFGSIANSLNIVVLTRREMRSPTNAILTGLAIADLLVMIDYIPYAIYFLPHLNLSKEQRLSYGWAWYILFHAIFAQIMHTISIWLTVTLAVWRYIAVGYPQKNRIWCSMQKTLVAIASSYVVCPILGIQLYISLRIKDVVETLDQFGNAVNMTAYNLDMNNNISTTTVIRNVTLYTVQTSHLAENNKYLYNFNFWIYSVVIKLIPCIALTILSLRLIGALLEAKRRRKQLTSNSSTMKQLSSVNGKSSSSSASGDLKSQKKRKNSKTLEKERQTDRTTRMLLAVLLLFLLTEFPQGILGLLNAVLEKPFFFNCYLKLGEYLFLISYFYYRYKNSSSYTHSSPPCTLNDSACFRPFNFQSSSVLQIGDMYVHIKVIDAKLDTVKRSLRPFHFHAITHPWADRKSQFDCTKMIRWLNFPINYRFRQGQRRRSKNKESNRDLDRVARELWGVVGDDVFGMMKINNEERPAINQFDYSLLSSDSSAKFFHSHSPGGQSGSEKLRE